MHIFHACFGLCLRLLPCSHHARQSQRSSVRRSLYFLHVSRTRRSIGPCLPAQDFDFHHFIGMSIRGMDGAALHRSLGTGQDGRLLESTHQHHFFRSASAILPRNFSISPNVGLVCLLPLFSSSLEFKRDKSADSQDSSFKHSVCLHTGNDLTTGPVLFISPSTLLMTSASAWTAVSSSTIWAC